MPTRDMTPKDAAVADRLARRGADIAEMILDETTSSADAFTVATAVVAVLLCGFPPEAMAIRRRLADTLAARSVDFAVVLDKLA